jgi:hypothetical protein
MVTTAPRRTDGASPIRALEHHLDDEYEDSIALSRFGDDTEMTPMLAVTVDGGRTRAAVLRDIFAFERKNPITVTGVHRHRIVVRAE